ncbi:hypothetical protein BGZ95_001101 [Linnemannia exigua]|uniref:MFS general substrate transporter n=1 Tax=Linnemannia exigua TaxID=604196 RepID=A0AAD4D7W6_9FUNG|nr:hypothetical protein BGZ95_001101 [Linnemannia exigua]
MTDHHTGASERQPLIDPRDRYTRIPRTQDNEQQQHETTIKPNDDDDIPQQDEASRLAALQALPWYKRPSIAWLLPFVFLLALVLGLSKAPQEQLIVKIMCNEYYRERETSSDEGGGSMSLSSLLLSNEGFIGNRPLEDPCNSAPVVALAASVLGRVRALKYISGFFTIGYITSLSDKYGRKPLIYMTLVPAMLTQLLIVYMARPTSNLGVGILYADGLFMGLMGAGILLEPCLNAYIADCTPRNGRSLSIGYVMVSLAVGMTIGSILSSFLHRLTHDYNIAMFISAGTLFFLLFYAILLPESLPKHARFVIVAKSDVGQDATASLAQRVLATMKSGLVTILDPVLLFLPGRIDASPDVNTSPSPYTLLILLTGYGIIQFASNGMSTILVPYTNLVYHWDGEMDGYYFGLSGAFSIIVYVVIFPLLHKLFMTVYASKVVAAENTERSEDLLEDQHQQSDANATTPSEVKTRQSVWGDLTFFIFGSGLYAVAYFIVALIPTQASMFLGKALGGVSVVDTMVMTLSSFLYGWILSKTSATMPSAVFLLSGVCTCLGVLAGMTLNDTPAPDTTPLASMNRLQLQAACVKLGLDSTPATESLRKQLREHDGYKQLHTVSSNFITTCVSTTATSETQENTASQLSAEDADVAMQDAHEAEESMVATVKVEQEGAQEIPTEEHQEQSPVDEAEAQPEAMAVEELSIKQEVMEEDVQETSPFQETTLVQVKTEKEDTDVVVKQEADTASIITIKQEKEEENVAIKQEKVDAKGPSDDVKKEDSPVPIAQRRQLWEARSAPTQQRSGLPVSKTRINNQQTTVRRMTSTTTLTTTAQVQKRRRTEDGEDDADVTMEEQSSPIPQSGTVRKLIGKFAGSSISAPSSPVGKKRRVDLPTSKSSPGPGSNSSSGGSSFPSIPKFKRVVKIPASGNRASSSLYAMGNSTSRSGAGAAGARKRAASDSASGSAGATTADRISPAASASTTTATTPKKTSSKPVSAETINRLATPKKINTPAAAAASAGALSNVAPVPAPNFGASTSTAPSTHAVTKARGPVLSTAVRAAQRAKK